MFSGLSEESKMNSNVDMGPDSGLATSAEDIPCDQESRLEVSKSLSSSVSSEYCACDHSTTPHRDTEKSWVNKAPHEDGSSVQSDFVDHILQDLEAKIQQRKAQNGNLCSENDKECSSGSTALNLPKQNCFIDAASLLDETEMQPLAASAQVSLAKDSLLSFNDNAEVSSASNYKILCHNQQELHLLHKDVRAYLIQPQKVSETEGSQAHQEADKRGSPRALRMTNQMSSSSTLSREEKPPSLIRSNTFELETEDDRLALLRQDYERRQGSLIFQRCLSQSSGPLSDGGSEHDQNQHCTSLILPEVDSSLGGVGMSLFPTHVVEDEIQTPDSLNSDVPESAAQEKCDPGKSEVGLSLSSDVNLNSSKVRDHNMVESLPLEFSSLTIKEISSPLLSRRKTDSAPILSGAAPPLPSDTILCERRTKTPQAGALSSAWVVDISDITNSPETRRKKGDLSVGSSCEGAGEGFDEQQASSESKSSSSGLGFFIDLKKPNSSSNDKILRTTTIGPHSKISRQSVDVSKTEKQNACEFFVDLKPPVLTKFETKLHHSEPEKISHPPEKKLFSMFIDIGDKVPPKAKPELTSRSRASLSPFSGKKKNLLSDDVFHSEFLSSKGNNFESDQERSSMTSVSSTTSESQPLSTSQVSSLMKDNFYVIDSESRSISQGNPCSKSSSKNFQSGNKVSSRILYFRSNSASATKRDHTINSSSSLPLSTTSRQLSTQSLQNAEDDSEDSSARKQIFSSFHASAPLEESQKEKALSHEDEMVSECSMLPSHFTVDSNESSVCSLETYSVHTPEQSSATDDQVSENKDAFQNFDSVKKDEHRKCSPEQSDLKTPLPENKCEVEISGGESFVRLSDLDKEPSGSVQQIAPSSVQRMSRSIPETSWIENRLLITRSTNGGPSVMSCSSRSLSRLFPHLSMHSYCSGRSKTSSTCSPLTEDIDTMRSSQVSDVSSIQSSVGLDYSTESTDVSSGRRSPATQLGDDLLKMFLEEISTDVIVEVGGRRIKAHKCILSSRCQYFAAILSGGWVESAGNVISLKGFSYASVHFALCHIYCGASTIPDQISLVELANLADVLSLEGLKDVITYTLKVKYCHFFHKPCAVCSVGVLECLPLAAAYGLDEIFRKSLRWITKYFVRIWPTKTFTSLPRELIEKCYQQHVLHMNPNNILETVLCCDKLLSTLPTLRWTEPIFILTSRLMEDCIKFMSENFCAVLSSENFLSLGRDVPWNVSRFQDSLISACERMPPDQSCRSYSQLCHVLGVIESPEPPQEMAWHPNFLELMVQLRDLSERTLIKQAVRAARTPGWGQMSTELRRKIQDAACLVLTPADHASSRYRRTSNVGSKQGYQHNSYSRNLDLQQVKMAMVQHARRSNSRGNHNLSTNPVIVRKNIQPDETTKISRRSAPVAGNKLSDKSTSVQSEGRPKTWPSQVKSRYLDKRPNFAKQANESEEPNKKVDAPVPQRRAPIPAKGIFISSSDSSRNSSPAMKRSSNTSASIAKTGDSPSKTKVTTSMAVQNPSYPDTSGSSKENGTNKICGSLVKRSSLGNSKNQSTQMDQAKISNSHTNTKGSFCLELISGQEPLKESYARKNVVSSHGSSALGLQPQNLTLSNESLTTVSSCGDSNLSRMEKGISSKAAFYSMGDCSTYASSSKKDDVSVSRTPLGLSNKKASPANPQRKALPSTLKSNVSHSIAPHTPSPFPKKSGSYVAKSPNLSGTGSRLAIPLRTSRSVSSVPDRNHSKSNNTAEGSLTKKTPRINNHSASKRTNSSNSNISSSTLAGRVSSSKGKKLISKGSQNGNPKAPEGISVDSSSDSTTVHPTVGPRSGTFLKDEPSVLNTPTVDDV